MASVPQISDLKHVFPILITFTTTHSMSSSCHFGVDFWWFFESFFSSSTPHHGHPKQPTLPPNGRIHSHPPNLSGPALTNYKVLVVQSPKPSPLAPWSVYAGNFVGCAPSHDNLLTGFLRTKGCQRIRRWIPTTKYVAWERRSLCDFSSTLSSTSTFKSVCLSVWFVGKVFSAKKCEKLNW